MSADQWGNVAGLAGTAPVVYPAIKATRLFQLAEEAKKVVQKIPSQQAQLTSWAQQVRDDVGSLREEWQPRRGPAFRGHPVDRRLGPAAAAQIPGLALVSLDRLPIGSNRSSLQTELT
jgi:hypothetical protein